MQRRFAIGIAGLAAVTSCGVPKGLAVSHVEAPHGKDQAAERPAVLPAGPNPRLLAELSTEDAGASDSTPATIAPAFHAATDLDDLKRATRCLTAAVYYEARSQSLGGQEAVAQVVLNRVRSNAFPDSVCGTVYEGSSRRTGCQFTFTCDGSLSERIEPAAWDRARRVATAALDGFVYAPVGSATYYHTTAVHPWWAPRLKKVAQIGAHIFYRMPGRRGDALAFNQRYSGREPAITPGTDFQEKPVTEAVDTIEAGVRVHRANLGKAERATVTRSFGVRVYRAGGAATATAKHASTPSEDVVHGVRVIRGNGGPET